jgi:nitroimidazol reductase NimA-like FMN-containing flavoprotein (pyridoxamine 5'-phosphate oxidase superfamily)
MSDEPRTMSDTPVSTIRDLPREECDALLAKNHVGRIAFSYRDHVDIEPISFVFDDGWLYGRTGMGTKLRTLAHNRWVAFETDEINAMTEWRSVVVKGALYLLEPDGAHAETYARAVEVLRSLNPLAFGAQDPTPERTVVFRIHADQVTGRSLGTHR